MLEKLKADPLWESPKLFQNPGFKNFLAHIPRLLEPLTNKPFTIETLMEGQYQCCKFLAVAGNEDFLRLEKALEGYLMAREILAAAGRTVEDYALRMPGGMDREEFQMMESGALTVGEMLERRPGVFLAPLLRLVKRTRN